MSATEEYQEDIPEETKSEFKNCGPLFPIEVIDDFNSVTLGERQNRGVNDSYVPITFYGNRLHVQTQGPVMCMFGLGEYKTHPDQKNFQYCIKFSLKPVDVETQTFADLMFKFEDWAKEQKINSKHKFISQIQAKNKEDKPGSSPIVTIKINRSGKRLIMDIIDTDGRCIGLPTIQECKKLLQHRALMIAVIEANPLWYAGNKYGHTWRMLKLKIVKQPQPIVHFRD